MAPQLSVYLDLIRFAAACVVMLSHLGGQRWTGGLGWQFVPFGAPAVDVFFVLSGYVIAYVAAEREFDLRSYAISRAARIYSVVVPVLLLTFIMGAIGATVRPEFDWGNRSVSVYLTSIIFLNQNWFNDVGPGNNGPYWSLCYEVWYYVLFAGASFLRGRQRVWCLAIWFLFAGPRIAVMLPVWLMGVGGYRITQAIRTPRVIAGFSLWLVGTLALVALTVWQFRHALDCGEKCYLLAAFARPLSDWPEYVADYSVSFLVACSIVGFAMSASLWTALTSAFRKPVKWAAGATFTLYLLHYPLAQFLIAVSPWPLGSARQQAFVYLTTLTVVFLVAQFTERRKSVWRHGIERFVAVWPDRRAPATAVRLHRPAQGD